MNQIIQPAKVRSVLSSHEAPVLKLRPDIVWNISDAKIMVVDDDAVNTKVVSKYLQAFGYTKVSSTTSPRQGLLAIREELPDLVILDVMMPEISGLDIMAEMQQKKETQRIPVLFLTAAEDRETRLAALDLGATDFLSKPVDPSELSPRIRNALTSKLAQDHLLLNNIQLGNEIRESRDDLIHARREAIECLARAGEFRDNETGKHVLRVGAYCGIIARQLGMPEKFIEEIELASQLHDLGKIGVSDSILHKPGKLNAEEFQKMQKHPAIGKMIMEHQLEDDRSELGNHTDVGSQILRGVKSPILQLAAEIALTHHERWDGSGYPLGLCGEDIPIGGRITAVADVFDALTSKRPYKPPFSYEKSIAIMEEGRGSHFDPKVLDAFMSARNKIIAVQLKYIDYH